jgi:hypothetical protein
MVGLTAVLIAIGVVAQMLSRRAEARVVARLRRRR